MPASTATPPKVTTIDRGFEGEIELQLRRQRLGMGVIDNVEIREDAENALLLRDLDLLAAICAGETTTVVFASATLSLQPVRITALPGVSITAGEVQSANPLALTVTR